MILPSDETPEKPGDSDPDDDFAWAAGATPESVPPAFADPYGAGGVEHPAPPGWREDLKRSVLEALKDISIIEDPTQDFDPPEPPDLFMFFGELAALRNEVRRGQKKLADGVSKLATAAGGSPATVDTAPAHELVALYDSIVAEGQVPAAAPLIEAALIRAGVIQIPVQPGHVFDPAVMASVSGKVPAKSAKVKSLQRAGFTWHGRLLRPALVEV